MRAKKTKKSNKKQIVFFDFDNTITKFDVIDDILCRFSTNDKWLELEEKWKKGEIGSRECLEGQLGQISFEKEKFDHYLTTVGLDHYFKRLIELLRSKKAKLIILTDDFDYIVKKILTHHGITGFAISSNKMKVIGGRIELSFPHGDKKCFTCAHCKRNNLLPHIDKDNAVVYYIGDGRSDVCVSKFADIVFAKGYLKEHYKEIGLECVPIDNLKDVYNYFQRS